MVKGAGLQTGQAPPRNMPSAFPRSEPDPTRSRQGLALAAEINSKEFIFRDSARPLSKRDAPCLCEQKKTYPQARSFE